MRASATSAELMSTGQVARLFCVDQSTVLRWAKAGRLTTVRTLGGHRRYRRDEVEAWLRVTAVPRQRGSEELVATAV
jgi:excisionase family DNA binding protein